MTRAGLLLLGAALTLAASAASAQTPETTTDTAVDCQPRQVTGRVSLSSTASRVAELVGSADAAPAERIPVLEQYLAQPREDAESVDFVLRNYARMVLGADYLQTGQFEQARTMLSKVRLDSPAGVPTALLIARSHQLEGNPGLALKWYVRVGERYPANPEVLRHVVEAAAMAEQDNPRLAAGIYERALKKALANIEDLSALKKKEGPLSEVLLEYPKDGGTTVGGQLVREILRTHREALPHLRHVLNTTEELACIEQRLEAVDEQLFQVTERGARIGSFQTMLAREHEAMRERLASLEREREQAYRSSEKQRIREEIERIRTRLQTQEQRQAELERQRRERTEGPEQRRRQLQQRQDELQAYLAENREAIEQELRQVMEELRKQYLDLAGEGQMGKARMMREITVNGAR